MMGSPSCQAGVASFTRFKTLIVKSEFCVMEISKDLKGQQSTKEQRKLEERAPRRRAPRGLSWFPSPSNLEIFPYKNPIQVLPEW